MGEMQILKYTQCHFLPITWQVYKITAPNWVGHRKSPFTLPLTSERFILMNLSEGQSDRMHNCPFQIIFLDLIPNLGIHSMEVIIIVSEVL